MLFFCLFVQFYILYLFGVFLAEKNGSSSLTVPADTKPWLLQKKDGVVVCCCCCCWLLVVVGCWLLVFVGSRVVFEEVWMFFCFFCFFVGLFISMCVCFSEFCDVLSLFQREELVRA